MFLHNSHMLAVKIQTGTEINSNYCISWKQIGVSPRSRMVIGLIKSAYP